MQGLRPTPEFEHLPQHGNTPLRWCIPQHVDHHARRIGIGVVAIVQNQNAFVPDPFSAHRTGPQLSHDAGKLLRADTENSRHRNSSQQIRDAVFAWERALKLDSADRKPDTFCAYFHIFGADVGGNAQAERDHSTGVNGSEFSHEWIVGIQYSDSIWRQSFDKFTLGSSHCLDRIECFHMRVADISHNTNPGFRDARQIADLARVIHPDFEHRYARVARQTKNR